MSYVVLVPATFCFVAAAWLCYHDARPWWYQPVGALTGALSTWLWFVGAQWAGSKQETYRLGLAWTVLAEACWLAVPLLFFGVRLNWWGVLGVVLLAASILLSHVGTEAAP